MLSKLTLKMFGCCSNNIVQHAAVVIGLKISSCAFWLKTFSSSLLSIFYQMILICGEGWMATFRRNGGWMWLFWQKIYIFALKILIAFGFSILHNILFLCREFRGRIYYSVSVRKLKRRHEFMNLSWWCMQPVSRNYSDDNFQGCRISFAHNLKKGTKNLWMKEFSLFFFCLVRGNASFLC